MTLDRIAVSLTVGLVTISVAATSWAQPQTPPPIREVITVTDRGIPPMTTTPAEELQRLSEVDAIAVVEVVSLEGEKTPATKVRGIVRDGVKASTRAALWSADGTIEFQFGGGDSIEQMASRGDREYPVLKAGERYLVFFDLHPFIARWYPTIPFRVDESGRLAQVEWNGPTPSLWKSPINGLPLSEAVQKLRKQ